MTSEIYEADPSAWGEEDERPRLKLRLRQRRRVVSRNADKPPERKAPKHFLFAWRNAFCAVPEAAIETGLPSTTRLVLWTVSRFMDLDGAGAHPGQERIAKDAGLSIRTTKLHLQLAVERGWLCRDLSHPGPHGVGYAYRAHIPREGDATQPGTAASRIRRAKKGDA